VTAALPETWDGPPQTRPPDGPVVANALMLVPAGEDAPEFLAVNPAGGFMNVCLVTFEARFDPEQDRQARRCRYRRTRTYRTNPTRTNGEDTEPHAPQKLQVSEPIVEWIQVTPERTVTASAETTNNVVLSVTAKGPASKRGA
jgi:hypothetical protein